MSEQFTRTYTWHDPAEAFAKSRQMSGLEYMQAICKGELPSPPIAETLSYYLTEVAEGFAVFEGDPQPFQYNPIGVVHGGVISTVLDSAMGCAVHTSLPLGMAYTTLQLNINLVRAVTLQSGRLRCEGRVIHGGRQMATAEATLRDASGKLCAHATTTCLVFPLPDGK